MKNETAGRGNVRPQQEATIEGNTTARVVARRLWPATDPIHYAKRMVVPTIAAADTALRTGIELRGRVDDVLFRDLVRLHIHPTYAESLLALLVVNLKVSICRIEDALAMMEAARSEILIRECDRRRSERSAHA